MSPGAGALPNSESPDAPLSLARAGVDGASEPDGGCSGSVPARSCVSSSLVALGPGNGVATPPKTLHRNPRPLAILPVPRREIASVHGQSTGCLGGGTQKTAACQSSNKLRFDCRTHFRSQVEFLAVYESYVHTHVRLHSPILTGYDRALFPRIVDIVVFEQCYAALAARTECRSKRKAGNKCTFSLSPHRSHLWLIHHLSR